MQTATSIEGRSASILLHKANGCLLCHHLPICISALPLWKVLQTSALLPRVNKGAGAIVIAPSLVVTGSRGVQTKLLGKITGLVITLGGEAILLQQTVERSIIVKGKGHL